MTPWKLAGVGQCNPLQIIVDQASRLPPALMAILYGILLMAPLTETSGSHDLPPASRPVPTTWRDGRAASAASAETVVSVPGTRTPSRHLRYDTER
jgi:hypothetical protein